jgi:hypothetical protein
LLKEFCLPDPRRLPQNWLSSTIPDILGFQWTDSRSLEEVEEAGVVVVPVEHLGNFHQPIFIATVSKKLDYFNFI